MSELPDKDRCHALYRTMLRIRRFEEKCGELYKQQKIRGFLHYKLPKIILNIS